MAGGTGTRMQSGTPKQFMHVAGKPLLYHSIRTFLETVPGIRCRVVIPEKFSSLFEQLMASLQLPGDIRVAFGGATRFHSVKNGLKSIQGEEGLVAIHDAARPLVSPRVILEGFAHAEEHDAAIPIVPLNDSVRLVKGAQSRSVDRSQLFRVQTPQCFSLALIKKAYTQPYDPSFTDSASVVEKTGQSLFLYEGDEKNIKVTHPEDLNYVNYLLEKKEKAR